jgi:ParB family chromosome partitioning protein
MYMTDFKMIPLKDIHPDSNQPRRIYDQASMEELTQSVREKGILQPILLRPNGKGYILVCGERRFRAAGTAGLTDIPAVIRVLTDEEALELQIIENLQRKDVHPMEEAVAFKSLLENKNKVHTVEEIASRIAKNVFYVRQRLRLNYLIKQWQTAFYSGRIGVRDAMNFSLFDEKIQADMYKERGEGTGEVRIDSWFINKYRGELNNASFDLSDPTLDKKMGACTQCQFNSAVASLFPDATNSPRCGKPSCFKHKSDIHFDRQLKIAKEDPEVVLVNTEYHSIADNLVRALMKEECVILNGRANNNFEVIEGPEKPDWEEWYEQNEDDGETSDAELKKQFDQECKTYETELAEFNEKTHGGKFKRAFVIHGNDRGKYVFIQVGRPAKGSSKATAEKVKEGKLTAGDITEEIKRIQDREKRNKELDINKIHAAIEAQAKKNKSKILALENKPIDRAIMIWILLTEIGYNPDWRNETMGYAFDKFKELSKWSDKQVSQRIRKIVFDQMVHAGSDVEVRHKHTAIRLIAEYAGIDIKAIELEQKEIADARIEKVIKRIADLQKKKKELQPVTGAAAKKTAKRKK